MYYPDEFRIEFREYEEEYAGALDFRGDDFRQVYERNIEALRDEGNLDEREADVDDETVYSFRNAYRDPFPASQKHREVYVMQDVARGNFNMQHLTYIDPPFFARYEDGSDFFYGMIRQHSVVIRGQIDAEQIEFKSKIDARDLGEKVGTILARYFESARDGEYTVFFKNRLVARISSLFFTIGAL